MFKEYREPPRREPSKWWQGYFSWQRVAGLTLTGLLITCCLIVNFEDLAMRG